MRLGDTHTQTHTTHVHIPIFPSRSKSSEEKKERHVKSRRNGGRKGETKVRRVGGRNGGNKGEKKSENWRGGNGGRKGRWTK